MELADEKMCSIQSPPENTLGNEGPARQIWILSEEGDPITTKKRAH